MKDRNTNRPGHKPTKAGWIPTDWKAQQLGQLTEMMTNGFVGTATDHYSEAVDAVTYVQGFNVKSLRFDLTGIKKVSRTFHEKNIKSALRARDLLTTQTGEIGVSEVLCCCFPPRGSGTNAGCPVHAQAMG